MAKLTREQIEQIIKEAWEKGETPDLRGADLGRANLSRANLSGANLREANLSWASLYEANLSFATLSGAHLHWVHLSSANLSEARLSGAGLHNAILDRANFSRANLNEANLSFATLDRANLSFANLSEATLSGAHLRGANFGEANLIGANFTGADLSEANLSKARVAFAVFGKIDLSKTKGLDTVKHEGPSTISTDTLHLSKGQIPEIFLRGCGLSNWEIEITKLYHPNLTSEERTNITYKMLDLLGDKPIQYYSCFISHSHLDHPFAEQLYNDLQDNGVPCWFAPEKMKIGDKIRPTIDRFIRLHDRLLLILSEHSINSNWVEKEVETAFEEESKRNQTVLFPIRLDETVMHTDQAWAADIRRTRHIGDFCGWEDGDGFQRGFQQLVLL